MNDETLARGGGDEHHRRQYEVLDCTMAFEGPDAAGIVVAQTSTATTPRDVDVRSGNLRYTSEIDRRAGDRT